MGKRNSTPSRARNFNLASRGPQPKPRNRMTIQRNGSPATGQEAGYYDPSGSQILSEQQQGMLDLTPEEIQMLLMRLLGDGFNAPEGYEEEQVCMPNEYGSYNCEEMMVAKPCPNCTSCNC